MFRLFSRFARTPFTMLSRKFIFTNNVKSPNKDTMFTMINTGMVCMCINMVYNKYQETIRIYKLYDLYKEQNNNCYSALVVEIEKLEEYSPKLADKLKNSLFEHLKKFNINSISNSKIDLSQDIKFPYSKIIPTLEFSIESSNPENYGFKNEKDNKIFLSLSKIIYLNREILANCREFLEKSYDTKFDKCFFDMTENFNKIVLDEYFKMSYNYPKK